MKENMIVTTFDGSKELRKDCRYISGAFYKKHKQCIKMPDNKWHRINNGLIEFDHSTKEWVFKGNIFLTKGVVDIDKENNLIIGYFSNIENAVVLVLDREQKLVINEKLLQNENFVEEISSGKYFEKKNKTLHLRKKYINGLYSFGIYYSFEHLYGTFDKNYIKKFKYTPSKNKFYDELKDITFGIEYETHNGYIPERHCLRTGLIPLKDGSLAHNGIEPYEYTTIPLSGEKGIMTIKENCFLLNKYCLKSTNGSLHIHIGNIKRTEKYIISLYHILYLLQKEIYEIFPKYYQKTSLFKSHGKDYCNPLPKLLDLKNKSISENLNDLFEYYIYGKKRVNSITENNRDNEIPRNPFESKKNSYYIGMAHPKGSNFDRKWNMNMRYKWCNLIPLLFNSRGTTEFRIHTASFNETKIINWLYIISAICKFADINQNTLCISDLKKLTLEEIISFVYSPDLSEYLNSYIEYRKKLMEEHFKLGDGIGDNDVKNDDVCGWKYENNLLL